LLLFGPDAVVLFVVVVVGGGAGLSAGMKPWQGTSWSFSASGRRLRLDDEAQGPALAAIAIDLAAFGPNAVVLVLVVIAAAVRACWRAQSRGGGPAGLPALAAVAVVVAARHEDQR